MDNDKVQQAIELLMSADINAGNFSRLGFAVIPLVQDQIREAIKLIEGEARLIAARPDMADALRLLIYGDDLQAAIDAARAALAKAAGGITDDLRFGEG